MLVLITSSVGTTITSLVQIAFEYGSAKGDQQSEVEVFASTAIPSMQNLIWNFNEEALKEQLHSAVTPEDFTGIVVINEKKIVQSQFKKDKVYKNTISKTFQLKNPTNNKENIGTVVLSYTNDFIIAKLKKKAIIILLSNLVKTFVISSLLLFLFRLHVVNRISALALFLKSQDWNHPQTNEKGKEFWPFRNVKDEFTDIEESLNSAVVLIKEKIALLELSTMSSARLAELGTLSAGIAHEINNPLAIISGYAKALEKNTNLQHLSNEQLIKYTVGISTSSTRISHIIKGLKQFARDGSDDPYEDFHVQNMVDEIKPLCEGMLEQLGVVLDFSLKDKDLMLNCRSVQISQVLLNMINNAADAIAHLEKKWINVSFFYDAEQALIISITDSGSGIPEEVRNRIFTPFFTTKEVGKGTGLGLAIVHGIVVQHGGTIKVNGDCPNTQFIIRFPKKEVKHVA